MRSWLLVSVGLGLGLGACEITAEEKTLQACTVICQCEEAPLPTVQDRCVAKCTADLDVRNVSDECIACVTANSDRCSTLESVCDSLCDPPSPTDDDGGIGL